MEADAAETRGKRKADSISPTRGHNQSASFMNDRKRRETLNSDEIVVPTCEDDEQASLISEEKESEDGNDSDHIGDDDKEEEPEGMSEFYHACDSDFDEEEFVGPEETEVAQKEHSLGDQKLTFKMFLAEDGGDDEFARWMQTIHVHCSYEGKEIGRGFGRWVQRNQIRATFWRDMEEPCRELSDLAFELFDRYGRLRKEFKNHPVRKGNGVWGPELDLGSFFVIEYMLIDKNWRRKTIGTKIVNYLMEKSRENGRDSQIFLVAPGWLNGDIESEIRGKTKPEQREIKYRIADNVVSFYRSLNFRRIGASSWFGLAADASHPARAILPSDDFDPALEEPDLDEGPEYESNADRGADQNRKSWRLELLKDRLPLHHAAITLSDSECVETFKAWKTSGNSANEWTKVDRHSNTVLHIAACELKVRTVRWLIDKSGNGQALSQARNVKGYNPVEELESDLETKRTRRKHGMLTIDISEDFSGFSLEAIRCLVALRILRNPSQIQAAQLKFGCTCGLCIDGFLSPRMSFALLYQAEVTHDMLNEGLEDGEMWCMMHDYWIAHVAPDIQRNFATNKSYRQGFANVFGHAASALRGKRSPTIPNILDEYANASEWPPHTRNFFQRGGTIESALRTLFENTQDQDEWAGGGSIESVLRTLFEETSDQDERAGDGTHMDIFEDQVKALPECRNDHEFGFVALMCGISKLGSLYG